MTTDRILLRDLRVMAYCGVLEEEQARRQPFQINIEVVAEMIETPDELKLVQSCGVDYVQGYLFGKPTRSLSEYRGRQR